MACSQATRDHATFSCGCNRKFFTEKSLSQHKSDREYTKKEKECGKCCRSFKDNASLNGHMNAKDHWLPGEKENFRAASGRQFCDDCPKSFKTTEGLKDHSNSKRSPLMTTNPTCFDCGSNFTTKSSLGQHQKDTGHSTKTFKNSKDARQTWFSNHYKNHVNVKPDDRQASVKTVRDTMNTIMKHVRGQDGGKVYSPDLRRAGSHAVKTKIGKADEFDYCVPLNMKDASVRTRGELSYKFRESNPNGPSPNNLNVKRLLIDDSNTKTKIPKCHAVASVQPGNDVPAKLLHGNDIISRYVKEDLHTKISKAIKDNNLDKKGVSLNRTAHGPALTLDIKSPGNHNINVDIVASLDVRTTSSHDCWPRRDTYKVLSSERIDDVVAAGTHLVPKGDATFYLSYSNAEKALMKRIDAGNGCRRMCHQVTKKMVQDYASRHPAPGITSHIFKHQLFNMNERSADREEGYWHQRNFGERMVDVMKDCEQVLRSGRLRNYFNTYENILAGKNPAVLNGLADHFCNEREKLHHIV